MEYWNASYLFVEGLFFDTHREFVFVIPIYSIFFCSLHSCASCQIVFSSFPFSILSTCITRFPFLYFFSFDHSSCLPTLKSTFLFHVHCLAFCHSFWSIFFINKKRNLHIYFFWVVLTFFFFFVSRSIFYFRKIFDSSCFILKNILYVRFLFWFSSSL